MVYLLYLDGHYTQRELAKLMGVSQPTISRIVKRENALVVRTLEAWRKWKNRFQIAPGTLLARR